MVHVALASALSCCVLPMVLLYKTEGNDGDGDGWCRNDIRDRSLRRVAWMRKMWVLVCARRGEGADVRAAFSASVCTSIANVFIFRVWLAS